MVAVPPWLQFASALATLILLAVLIVLVIGVIPVMVTVRREVRRTSDELTRALGGAGPMLRDASTLLTELREIAVSVRADVVTVHQFVTDTDSRARAMTQRAEARLAELDATFGVLRDGLEDAVVSVAAVAHGVRVGTAALGIGTEDSEEEPEAAPDTGAEGPSGDEDDFMEEPAAAGSVQQTSPAAGTAAWTSRGAAGATHNGDDRAGSPGRRAQPRIRGQRREE